MAERGGLLVCVFIVNCAANVNDDVSRSTGAEEEAAEADALCCLCADDHRAERHMRMSGCSALF